MRFAEAEYDTTQRAFKGRADDDKLMIKFELFPHLDQEKSQAEGRPIYYDREYITIIVPGDKDSIVHRPVWSKDIERFPRQYQAFKNNESQETIGTPLKLWGGCTLGQAKELEYFNVKTVEQLAGMSDGNAMKFQGINALRQRARDYIAHTKEQQPLLQMRAELEDRDNTVATMQRQLAEMAAELKILRQEREKAQKVA